MRIFAVKKEKKSKGIVFVETEYSNS